MPWQTRRWNKDHKQIPMTNRLYNKVSTNVDNWGKEVNTNACGSYETAKKGLSALDAALYRTTVAEIAHCLGQFVACALNDFRSLPIPWILAP